MLNKRQTFQRILFMLLIVSGTLSLLTRPYLLDQIRNENLPPFFVILGPLILGGLFLIFLIERFAGKTRDPLKRTSFLPILFGTLLILYSLPSGIREYQIRTAPSIESQAFLLDLLASKDARIRALVMLAAPFNEATKSRFAAIVQKGLSDNDPLVRHAALYAIEKHLGFKFLDSVSGLKRAIDVISNWEESKT